jgi:hypothetical protein
MANLEVPARMAIQKEMVTMVKLEARVETMKLVAPVEAATLKETVEVVEPEALAGVEATSKSLIH